MIDRLDQQDRRRPGATGRASIATRLIGVTRIRSTTPLRSSAMSPKPPNAVAEDRDLDEQARARTS